MKLKKPALLTNKAGSDNISIHKIQLTLYTMQTYHAPVAAKSVTRPSIRQIYKAHSRIKRFFCARIQSTCPFMVRLLGASSGAPVSLYAGHASPSNLTTNPESSISPGGSTIQGTSPMTDAVKNTPFTALGTLTATDLAALSTTSMHPSFFAALLKAWRLAA